MIVDGKFLSTPPSRVATAKNWKPWKAYKFLSTPPSRVATATFKELNFSLEGFYPRHPRGWRLVAGFVNYGPADVSIHATLAGGDSTSAAVAGTAHTFLSTPPSRVATGNRNAPDAPSEDVSIHATLAGGDGFSLRR